MSESIYFNPKYHVATDNKIGIFSSFTGLKVLPRDKIGLEYRPPFPIIKSHPTLSDLILSINKSDILLYFTFMTGGFAMSMVAISPINIMRKKIAINHYIMHCVNLTSLSLVLLATCMRMSGFIDNGMRWKSRGLDDINKYDMLTEYESQTPLKHLR